ncbi:YxlC family protein [uncultured Brevibacillus sp.]|uniref:YxlC family protein n=1 Tax=uncultured Brevibacillus sp. TaxID=169970 RepID=UPI002594A0A4|nr:YxlC family protein [uncultured Brevibacillus sp.]
MNKHPDEDNDQLYQKMREGLDELDELFPSATPDPAFFQSIVSETTKRTKKRIRYELLAFWCVALVVLSMLYFIQSQALIIYFLVQGLSFLALVLILAKRWVGNHDTTP